MEKIKAENAEKKAWLCELCNESFGEETLAIELKFGYVDSEEAAERESQYLAFYTEEAVGPVCDDCAIGYIKGDIQG